MTSTNITRLEGRTAETERLLGLLTAARDGTSGVICLRGEAGIGKTALLDLVARRSSGGRILRATGHESEREVAYAGLSQLLVDTRHLIDRLPEPQRKALLTALAEGSEGEPDPLATGTALLGLLGLAARDDHAVVLVDDAQWLDPATGSALVFACRRLDAEGVAVVLAARPGVESDRFSSLPQLELRGLDVVATVALVESATSHPVAESVARRIHDGTRGNPLAVVEATAMLSEEQLVGAVALPDPLPIPDHLQSWYRARLQLLPVATQAALLVLAIGSDVPAAVVKDALDDNTDPGAILEPAERAGLISVTGDTIAFRHPLVRAAVYHGSTAASRREAHRRVAEVADNPDLVAWHLAEASLGPDQQVAALLAETAARAHRRGAHVEAARAHGRAAELATETAFAVRQQIEAATQYQLAGDLEAAGSLVGTIVPGDDAEAKVSLEHLRATLGLFRGDPLRLRDLLLANAAALEPVQPSAAARLYLDAIVPCVVAGESAAALHPARAAARLLEHDHPLIDLAFGVALTEECRELDASPRLERAGKLIAEFDLVTDHALVAFTALALGVHRHLGPAHRLVDRLVAQATMQNVPGALPFALAVSSMLHYWSGSWSRSDLAASEATDLARSMGRAVAPGHVFAMFIAGCRGREAECLQMSEIAMQSIDLGGEAGVQCWHEAAMGRFHLGFDRPAEARSHLEAALDLRPPGGVPDWRADLIEALDRTGSTGRADVVLDWLTAWSQRNRSPLGELLVTQALLRRVDHTEVDDLADRAGHLIPTANDPFARARFELEHGERLRRDRRLTEARISLRSAFRGFDRLEAAPWRERAGRELRASGGTSPDPRPDALSTLTSQELRIALEVAEGATNQEVAVRLLLSAKTVAFHLGNAYRKLGIRSRVELTRMVLEATSHGKLPERGGLEPGDG